ncbi:MAG: SDR family NAD(P)-dependent oxidoreductase [Propionibacteriales bacterium]|nr:SDR family NAD(P)-dependent oxidoreductase [Propionibacteriales bacterium]
MPTALITGPTAGIGRAFANAYAERGFDLVLVSRDEVRLKTVAEDLSARHAVTCEVLPADLSDRDAVERVVARIDDQSRPIDALVNNAGFGLNTWFGDTDFADEERSLDVLVRAPLRLTHTAVKQMDRRGDGEIVNVSSVAGFLPRGTYGAHKAWLTSLSAWLNQTYRRRGVRVMALCPGFVRTEFHQRGNMNTRRIPGWMWLDADDLVAEALHDLAAGKAISVPSRRYRALMTLARLTPRSLLTRVSRLGR